MSKKNKTETSKVVDSKKIDELQSELEKEREGRLRAMADLLNYKRRIEEEKAKFGVMTNMQIVLTLLEILDDIAFARNDSEVTGRGREVIEIMESKIKGSLTFAGVEEVNVKIGDNFDPSTMEAITTLDAGEDKKGLVIDVVSKAYRYAATKQVIKHAKVVVGK